MSKFYDGLETRTADAREADLTKALIAQLENVRQNAPGFVSRIKDVSPNDINSLSDLAKLPILRKSEIAALQKDSSPLGGLTAISDQNIHHLFQSPGPIYEPGMRTKDWWRMGRFLHACGIGKGDIVQNCFSYHFTPAGMIFESGAAAVGATVFPAGTGQTELQARAARDLKVTAYAGTPDYLNIILEKADELGLDLSKLKKAAVGGGPLFPALRQAYEDRGIKCLQCYATADLGNIAYESDAKDGMIIDEGVIVEIVTPGTGNRVPDGEIGEVIVTTFNKEYPLIRFATGDLSAMMQGTSPCGRTNKRIVGWRGRADQSAKVKGMFIRPEQVAQLVEKHELIKRARIIITNVDNIDVMSVKLETESSNKEQFESSIKDVLKLRAIVEICPIGSLAKDGIVIEDQRKFGLNLIKLEALALKFCVHETKSLDQQK